MRGNQTPPSTEKTGGEKGIWVVMFGQVVTEDLLNRLAVAKQSRPYNLSYREVTSDLIQKKGGALRALTAGAWSNYVRILTRQSTRAATLTASEGAYHGMTTPEFQQDHTTLTKNFGKIVMVAMDPVTQQFLERIKTAQMTSSRPVSARSILSDGAFKGMSPLVLRQYMYFFLLFGSEKTAKEYFGKSELNAYEQLGASMATSAVYVGLSGPLDKIKTRMQSQGSTERSIIEAAKGMWNESGKSPLGLIRSASAGGAPRILNVAFSSFINLAMANSLKRS